MADTIFALSSGPGRAGVAVVRISGPRAKTALAALAGRVPTARVAAVRLLRRPRDGADIDQALVLWFPAPRSFTGEDCAELHVHGGRAVIAGVIDALRSLDGCRIAEPGEFTRRAFENGKLDLTAAEGIADLIDAETEAQRTQAMRQMVGGLAGVADAWRAELVRAMGLVEAAIDFADESDVVERVTSEAGAIVSRLAADMEAALADGRRGEILRDGFTIVIAGPPNAGKSSLLNTLARRDAAIVSEEPGTTRDVVEVRMDLDGVPVLVMDTAGIRDAPGAVEREGIRRSLARASDADLVLWLEDVTREAAMTPSGPPPGLADAARIVRVLTKIDLAPPRLSDFRVAPDLEGSYGQASDPQLPRVPVVALSTLTGEGVEALLDVLRTRSAAVSREPALITRARHRAIIEDATAASRRFLDGEHLESELRAEDLRQAAHALGKLTGRVDVEEVLGEIFGRFCIGK